MDDAVKRVEKLLLDKHPFDDWCVKVEPKDIRAIIEENKRLREALGEIDRYDGGGFCGRIAYCALKGDKP